MYHWRLRPPKANLGGSDSRDSLACEFPQILRRMREVGMDFAFAELEECNLHMVQEFYANWAPEARSHFVTVRGLHYTDITRGRVCLVYALLTGMELNIGVIMKSSMRKTRVHKGHMYAFDGGLITKMFRVAGVLGENVDYMAPLYPTPVDITRSKGPDIDFGPTIITVERHRRDELIMARMHYFLNDHAKALLGISPEFREPIENDIPTDEENLRTWSDVDSVSEKEMDPAHMGYEVDGDDAMED
ncbi:hypothetical protein H5410_026290 [Solanum commersonii]|uniref:Uncharacterized protein n=1 Tax=Solanum commersonii TaxID=4109 RepID=A0A9J5Z128_SOLCO|nr:hypothetical protein H5410_026290 [Solanum commersonii]